MQVRKPIREKGYYRAARRGEHWAIDYFKQGLLSRCLNRMYRFVGLEEIVNRENPFLKYLSKHEGFFGAYVPTKFLRPGQKRKRVFYRRSNEKLP